MREMPQDRIALDRASVRSFDALSGHMHVTEANISKACVNPYLGREIPGHQALGLDPDKTYRLLRDPKELEAAAQSFDGKPIVLVHREQSIDDADAKNRVGAVSAPRYEHPYLKARLALWTKEAINAVESQAQRQLSCGYGYEPDMTPGVFEGERYDGVMRALKGNHLALVKEGRAGPDVMVGDALPPELKEAFMPTKAVSTRAAAVAKGALMIHLRPKLAQDAKIDLGPALAGITGKNILAKKAAIVTGVEAVVKGKLAQDADIADLAEVIEAIAPILAAEVEEEPAPDQLPAEDEDPVEAIRKKLKAKGMSDEDIAELCGEPTAADSDAPPPEDIDDSPRPAEQGQMGTQSGAAPVTMDMKKMVSKTAMDQALAAVRKTAVAEGAALGLKTAREIATAEKEVAPFVGEIKIACDSAEAVYRHALKALKVEHADTMHADALRPVLLAQPKPGDVRPARKPIAADSAADADYATRFPNAGRLKK